MSCHDCPRAATRWSARAFRDSTPLTYVPSHRFRRDSRCFGNRSSSSGRSGSCACAQGNHERSPAKNFGYGSPVRWRFISIGRRIAHPLAITYCIISWRRPSCDAFIPGANILRTIRSSALNLSCVLEMARCRVKHDQSRKVVTLVGASPKTSVVAEWEVLLWPGPHDTIFALRVYDEVIENTENATGHMNCDDRLFPCWSDKTARGEHTLIISLCRGRSVFYCACAVKIDSIARGVDISFRH
jgi:hypothetical protein